MDLPKQLGDLECSMFEPPAKRSRPSPFQISQAVPKRFLKAYTHVPDEKMGTVSLFGRIFPALVALLTSELCFHKFKATLVLRVEMTKTTADGKSKVERPYFSSKPYYRKRGSASYIVREWLLWEGERERERERETPVTSSISRWNREWSCIWLPRRRADPTRRRVLQLSLSVSARSSCKDSTDKGAWRLSARSSSRVEWLMNDDGEVEALRSLVSLPLITQRQIVGMLQARRIDQVDQLDVY